MNDESDLYQIFSFIKAKCLQTMACPFIEERQPKEKGRKETMVAV